MAYKQHTMYSYIENKTTKNCLTKSSKSSVCKLIEEISSKNETFVKDLLFLM